MPTPLRKNDGTGRLNGSQADPRAAAEGRRAAKALRRGERGSLFRTPAAIAAAVALALGGATFALQAASNGGSPATTTAQAASDPAVYTDATPPAYAGWTAPNSRVVERDGNWVDREFSCKQGRVLGQPNATGSKILPAKCMSRAQAHKLHVRRPVRKIRCSSGRANGGMVSDPAVLYAAGGAEFTCERPGF